MLCWNSAVQDLYEMLQQFFTLFPQYRDAQFFPFGESYAGKYVPSLAHKIHEENIALASRTDGRENWLRINLGNTGAVASTGFHK